MHGHVLEDLVGDLGQIALVSERQDDLLHAGAHRRQDLLLDPAHRQDIAAQGDLAGHGHLLPDLLFHQQGDQGREHGHSGRGPVLGGAAFGHMDMEIEFREFHPAQPQLPGVGTDIGQGGGGGLLHHIA